MRVNILNETSGAITYAGFISTIVNKDENGFDTVREIIDNYSSEDKGIHSIEIFNLREQRKIYNRMKHATPTEHAPEYKKIVQCIEGGPHDSCCPLLIAVTGEYKEDVNDAILYLNNEIPTYLIDKSPCEILDFQLNDFTGKTHEDDMLEELDVLQ